MHLDHGLLSFGYDGLFEKDPRQTCYSAMFPITPIEIGEGFVVGKERVVSSVNRTFDSSGGDCAGSKTFKSRGARLTTQVHFYGDGGFLTHTENVTGASVRLRLRGPDRLAVIVWPE